MLLATSSAIVASTISGATAISATALGWWLVERTRKKRGRGTVLTSEASDLWKASEDLREALERRAGSLQEQVDSLNVRVGGLLDSNDGLRQQLDQAQRLGEQLRLERVELSAHVTRLERANEDLQRMNAHLVDQVDDLTALLKEHDIDLGPALTKKEVM